MYATHTVALKSPQGRHTFRPVSFAPSTSQPRPQGLNLNAWQGLKLMALPATVTLLLMSAVSELPSMVDKDARESMSASRL
jgi:hypothetical protein